MSATAELRAKASLDGSGFQAGIVGMQRGVKGLSDSLNNTLKSKLAAAFGTAAIGLAVKQTVEYGSRISDTSKRLNVTAESLQELTYAAQQNGAELSDVTTTLEKLNVARDEALSGNKELVESFQRLGLSVDDLKSKRADELLNLIGKTVQSGDAQQLIKPLRDVAGRSAGALVTAFKVGLDAMAEEAQAKGLIIKDNVVESLDAVGDKFTELKFVMMGNLAPAIIWVVDRIYDLVDVFKILGTVLGGLTTIKPKNILTGAVAGGLGPAAFLKSLFAEVGRAGKEFGPVMNSELDEIAKGRAARSTASKAEPVFSSQFGGGDATEKKTPNVRALKPESDSLVSIGNFLGANQNVFSQIAQKQLDVAKEALSVHYKILNQLSLSGALPNLPI